MVSAPADDRPRTRGAARAAAVAPSNELSHSSRDPTSANRSVYVASVPPRTAGRSCSRNDGSSFAVPPAEAESTRLTSCISPKWHRAKFFWGPKHQRACSPNSRMPRQDQGSAASGQVRSDPGLARQGQAVLRRPNRKRLSSIFQLCIQYDGCRR